MHVRIILTVHLLWMNQSSDCFEVLCQRRNETRSSCWSPGTRQPRRAAQAGSSLGHLAQICLAVSCVSLLRDHAPYKDPCKDPCVSDKLSMVSRSKVFSARHVLCTTRSFTGLVAAPLSLRCLRLCSLPPSPDMLHWPPHANYVTFKLFAFQPRGAGLSLSLGLYTSSSVSAGNIAKLGPRQSRSFLITAVSPLFITDIADSINACVWSKSIWVGSDMEHSCIVLYDFQGFREIKVVKFDFLSTTGNYISFRSPTLSLLVSVELTCLTESQAAGVSILLSSLLSI